MKDGKFETTKEIIEALFKGETIEHYTGATAYLEDNGSLPSLWGFGHPQHWKLSPKKLSPKKLSPKKRETIELSEYIVDGSIELLTDKLEYTERRYCKNELGHYRQDDRSIQKLPNGRTFKVYADTLEFVTEGE